MGPANGQSYLCEPEFSASNNMNDLSDMEEGNFIGNLRLPVDLPFPCGANGATFASSFFLLKTQRHGTKRK
jgi:hypothetical protein